MIYVCQVIWQGIKNWFFLKVRIKNRPISLDRYMSKSLLCQVKDFCGEGDWFVIVERVDFGKIENGQMKMGQK